LPVYTLVVCGIPWVSMLLVLSEIQASYCLPFFS
jgi:hypothetical protein